MSNAETPPLYSDQQVIAATGMPVDSLRRLITWGAVKPAQSGGGRGRVRLWTTRQVLRISTTAQFADAGFSLQMAHTLTYCFPLDHLVTLYDPENLRTALEEHHRKFPEEPTDGTDTLLTILISKKQPDTLPLPGDYDGSETVIVDGRYLYSDVFGDTPTLMAEITPNRQRVIPYYGALEPKFYDDVLKMELATDVSRIDKRSLLIDRKYLSKKGIPIAQRAYDRAPAQLNSRVLCKSLVSINLALGFVICVRTLRGLPVAYRPRGFWVDGTTRGFDE
jgi:DNA-binding transcriptional MerR regulator